MKKFYVLSLFCLAMIPSMAENTSQVNDTVQKQPTGVVIGLLM